MQHGKGLPETQKMKALLSEVKTKPATQTEVHTSTNIAKEGNVHKGIRE